MLWYDNAIERIVAAFHSAKFECIREIARVGATSPMASRKRSPLRCPVCNGPLRKTRITPLGSVTADLRWELHAGECPEHGWFQAEVISRPPREIFAVTRPGGIARKFTINGKPLYAFPTIWNRQDPLVKADPYDARYWEVDWSKLPTGTVVFSS